MASYYPLEVNSCSTILLARLHYFYMDRTIVHCWREQITLAEIQLNQIYSNKFPQQRARYYLVIKQGARTWARPKGRARGAMDARCVSSQRAMCDIWGPGCEDYALLIGRPNKTPPTTLVPWVGLTIVPSEVLRSFHVEKSLALEPSMRFSFVFFVSLIFF